MPTHIVVASIISDLLGEIGWQEIVRVVAVIVIGGLALALFAAGFIKSVAKNINVGMVIAGILFLSVAGFVIAGIIKVFNFTGA